MEWLWVAQVTVNFLFLIGMIFWWTDRRGQRTKLLESRMQAMLGNLERRAKTIESQSHEVQRRMDESFGLMAAVGHHAKELLQRSREEVGRRVPTLEEQDLLSLVAPPASKDESAAPASSDDMPLGLKAVLREQLF